MLHQDNPDHNLTNNVKPNNEKDKRVKPIVPAKPTFIPPPANNRQSILVQGTPSQRSTTFRSLENQHSSSHTKAKCSKSTSSHIVPSSPNLACSNDCCGIPLPGTSSSKQQTNHNHNNNNNNNSKETCNQSQQRQADQRSSNDSLDCSSSISSNSGGFKDPEFIARQNEFERQLEAGKMKMVIGDGGDSRFNCSTTSAESQMTVTKKQPPESINQSDQSSNRSTKTPNTFFQQSTKQLEQMLAQRIEKENRCVQSQQQQQQHQINKKKRTTTPSIGTSRPESTTENCVQDQVATSQASSSLCKQEPNISTLQKQFQHRLHDEMKLHCKSIQEKHLIEKRLPQEHYKPAVDEDHSVKIIDEFQVSFLIDFIRLTHY